MGSGWRAREDFFFCKSGQLRELAPGVHARALFLSADNSRAGQVWCATVGNGLLRSLAGRSIRRGRFALRHRAGTAVAACVREWSALRGQGWQRTGDRGDQSRRGALSTGPRHANRSAGTGHQPADSSAERIRRPGCISIIRRTVCCWMSLRTAAALFPSSFNTRSLFTTARERSSAKSFRTIRSFRWRS